MNPKKMLFAVTTGFGTAKNGVDLGLAMRALGNHVEFFDVDWKPAHLRLTPKPLRRNWWQPAYVRAMNQSLVERVRRERPAVVFFLSGFQITADTIAAIRALGAKTVAYWVDDPVDDRGFEKAGLYDLFLTNDRQSLPRYHQAGVKSVRHFPSAVNEKLFFPIVPRPALSDVGFVGTHSPYRESILQQLLDYDLKVYGPGWKKNSTMPARCVDDEVFGERTNMVYNSSRINLNIHTWFGVGSAMNLRLFEVPCAGAFLLTDWVDEINGSFVENEHIACYRNVAELKERLDYFLAHETERARIAAAGRAHVLASHTYRSRAVIFDQWCDQLLGNV
jgi:spore maturation protein CgeB